MGTGCLELAHAAHWSSFENSCPQRAPVIAALCRRLPWTCAGSWVLRELDAMEGKRSLDNLSFQKKATLSLSTYMVCTIFLQMHTTVHSLSEDRSLSNKWDSASASDASADLLYLAVPDLSVQEQTCMSLQWSLFSPFSTSCNGIFLGFDAPCSVIPLSH